MNLSSNVKVTMVSAGAASAGTAIDSAAVDMEGFEGVIFVGTIATADAANFANLAQSTTSGGSYANLAGTKVVTGDDADSYMIDLVAPSKQFVRCEIDRGGTNTATGDIYAIQYGAAKAPTSHGATIDSELHVSPAEGTI